MTTRLQLHEVPKEIAAMEGAIRDLIDSLPDIPERQRHDLLREARFQIHQTSLLVVTGQYSSGKSSLIQALTDGGAEVVVDADISTDDVTEHRWGDVLLVDTPGVKAGVAHHDQLAEGALSRADLVIFTVTGHGFDDTLSRHAAFVADELGKHDQMVVVWTQRGKFMPDMEVQEAHLRTVFGTRAGDIPVITTDARWYLEGLADPTSSLGARKLQESGIDGLRAALNTVSMERGELARYRQPLQSMLVVLNALESHLVDDPDERVAMDLLTRQEKAVVRQMESLDTSMRDARRRFEDDCLRQASLFADAVESAEAGSPADVDTAAEAAAADLRAGLDEAANRYADGLERDVRRIIKGLQTEWDDIDAGPQARRLEDIGAIAVEGNTGKRRRTPFARIVQPPPPPPWAKDLSDHMAKMHKLWGAGGGLKDSSGSMGHKIVLDFGKKFGVKYRPWQAIKIADKLGKAMKFAGPAILVGSALYQLYAEERSERQMDQARQKRRNVLRETIRSQARSIADEAEIEVRGSVVDPLQSALDEIEQTRREIIRTQRERSQTQRNLDQLRQQITDATSRLEPGAAQAD